MKIKIEKADNTKIKELELESAFTWEGMCLSNEDLETMAQHFLTEQLVKQEIKEITGFTWDGKTMNMLYDLHGDNKYQDDLPFLCFDSKIFNGIGNLNTFKLCVGARWLDDIVRNNTM